GQGVFAVGTTTRLSEVARIIADCAGVPAMIEELLVLDEVEVGRTAPADLQDPPGAAVEPLSHSLARFVAHLRKAPLPRLEPPLGVIVPPRPVFPDIVADRQQEALWTGTV